jgi:hypothetical protein
MTALVTGLIGGAASRAAKEIILHPIDTIKYATFMRFYNHYH